MDNGQQIKIQISSKSGKIQRLKSYKSQNNLDQAHVDIARNPLFKTYSTHKNYYSRKCDLPCLPAGIRSYYSPRVLVPLLHSQVAPLVLKIIPWIRPYLTTYINSVSYRTFSTAQRPSWYFTNINHGLKATHLPKATQK